MKFKQARTSSARLRTPDRTASTFVRPCIYRGPHAFTSLRGDEHVQPHSETQTNEVRPCQTTTRSQLPITNTPFLFGLLRRLAANSCFLLSKFSLFLLSPFPVSPCPPMAVKACQA